MTPLSKTIVAIVILAAAALLPVGTIEGRAQEAEKDNVRQQLLEKAARQSLWRLKSAIKKDGFSSARVALNIWRSNALEAGTFDASQYNQFRRRIYEKSIEDNLRWFEKFVEYKDYADARICLRVWRIHSKEIGTFDETRYGEFKKKLK